MIGSLIASSPDVRMPPIRMIQAALTKTTETLAQEISAPSSVAPNWSAFEWQIATAASAVNGMSGLLATRLKWSGPPSWQAFLQEQHHQTCLRTARVGDLLARLNELARDAGVAVLALKGSALYAMRIYVENERPMGDIDLLVDPSDLAPTENLLLSLGYSKAHANWRHITFEPARTNGCMGFGERSDNPIPIELHCRIAERLPVREVDITDQLMSGAMLPGVNTYPSHTALLKHLLLHAAGNMRARALRYIQIHDIARLAGRMNRGDWDEFMASCEGDSASAWWLLPPLLLTQRYFLHALPAQLISLADERCPTVLKLCSRRHRLSDVSWSNIRIRAFPGIEWSRSPMEALHFMRSRLWPRRTEIAELRHGTSRGPTTHIPWYGKSHGWRILRWLLSSPPRVQTYYSVRCALGDSPRLPGYSEQ